jgi:predicted ATP-grasp superfamily ATP-dependent carboligase
MLVGIDLSSLALSSKKAGYNVYTADYFGDIDLVKLSTEQHSMINQTQDQLSGKFEDCYNPLKFIEMAKQILKQDKFSGILLSSGLDDSYTVLRTLDQMCKIIGNSPETIRKVRNKENFYNELQKLNIKYPQTKIVKSIVEAVERANEIGYPIVLKPSEGFAGSRIRKVSNQKQLEEEFKGLSSQRTNEIIVQEFIEGIATSASFLSNNSSSILVSINEQLLGLKEMYQLEPFGYCGNVTPYNTDRSTFNKYSTIIEKISKNFKLVGSNGVDITLTHDNVPYVIEVNPRFQGSLGCVERAYDLNMVKMHMTACIENKIPKEINPCKGYSTRLILYTPKKIIAANLVFEPNLSDIPVPGSIIEEGEPFCSIFTEGETREQSYVKAQKKAKNIFNQIL